MSSIDSMSSNRFVIGDRPVLRGADLAKEAESMPAEITDFGNGVVVERRGSIFKMTGTAPLSMSATIAAYEATRMGGAAGKAMFDTYRKTNADQFTADRSWDINPNGLPPAPPTAPVAPQRSYGSGTVTHVANGGTFAADPKGGAVSVEGGKSVTASGSAGDDFLQALYGSTLFGLAGNDRLVGQERAVLDGGDGDDHLSAWKESTLFGGDGNDWLEAQERAVLDGGAGDDVMLAYEESTLRGGAGNDTMSAYKDSFLDGGDGDDVLSANKNSTLIGGAGNDRMSASKNSFFDGGDGDDVLSADENSTLMGGAGNDRLDANSDAILEGGDGDDHLSGDGNSQVTDLSGDNEVFAGANSRVTTGSGNDRIQASDGSVVEAGDGHNFISAGSGVSVVAGNGDDMVLGGSGNVIATGAGNDFIKVWGSVDVTAGTGDDRVMVGAGSTIHFNKGDGHDSVGGGEWGQAYTATSNLSSSLLSFGVGITPGDVTMQRQGNDLLISMGADSITLKDVQRHGIPSMTFTDGTLLKAADVEAKVGSAEPYKPASQVMQRWYDANAAYNAKLGSNSTASADA